jgi:DNA-binding response OmpR family regulator
MSLHPDGGKLPAPSVAVNGERAGKVACNLYDSQIRDSRSIDRAMIRLVISTGDLRVNLDTKTVDVNGQRVHLTGKEYQMLELLSLRKGTTLTKEMFLNHLYGGMDEPELKIIDVFICKLRKKLQAATSGKHYIETVWGRGYMLRDPREEGSEAA